MVLQSKNFPNPKKLNHHKYKGKLLSWNAAKVGTYPGLQRLRKNTKKKIKIKKDDLI